MPEYEGMNPVELLLAIKNGWIRRDEGKRILGVETEYELSQALNDISIQVMKKAANYRAREGAKSE